MYFTQLPPSLSGATPQNEETCQRHTDDQDENMTNHGDGLSVSLPDVAHNPEPQSSKWLQWAGWGVGLVIKNVSCPKCFGFIAIIYQNLK